MFETVNHPSDVIVAFVGDGAAQQRHEEGC